MRVTVSRRRATSVFDQRAPTAGLGVTVLRASRRRLVAGELAREVLQQDQGRRIGRVEVVEGEYKRLPEGRHGGRKPASESKRRKRAVSGIARASRRRDVRPARSRISGTRLTATSADAAAEVRAARVLCVASSLHMRGSTGTTASTRARRRLPSSGRTRRAPSLLARVPWRTHRSGGSCRCPPRR